MFFDIVEDIEIFVQNQINSLDENDLMALYYFTINENFQNYIDNFEINEATCLKTGEDRGVQDSQV